MRCERTHAGAQATRGRRRSAVVAAALLLFTVTGCGPAPQAGRPALAPSAVNAAVRAASARHIASTGGAAFAYPPEGALFPRDAAPPTLRWSAAANGVTAWVVSLQSGAISTHAALASGVRAWRPDAATWRRVAASASTGDAAAVATVVGVAAANPDRILASARVRFAVSPDPVGAPILYRDVPLPFLYAVKNPATIRWRLATADGTDEPPVVLENLPVCGNCHSTDRAGRTLGMDVDYANDKGSYALTELADTTQLTRDRIITWSDFRRDDGDLTFGLLSRVSPCGQYVLSTVKDRSVFVGRPDIEFSQLFFPVKGVLAVYDRERREFTALPGADDPAFVQSNPEWSPDGQWVYFCRAPAMPLPDEGRHKDVLLTDHLAREFVEKGRSFRFDIWRVPFNDRRGGRAEAVAGASDNGMSNFFPKLSPDGRWLVFCRARNYMLLQPDSELWIVPAAGGEARRMACNTPRMNSWHAWSPNGRWLVFASKAHGPYTQLCLTHVDTEGRDAPAILIESASLPRRACNIPEFVNRPPDRPFRVREQFVDSHNLRRQGQVVLQTGDFESSIPLFARAIELDPGNHDARLRLAAACLETGRDGAALRELDALVARGGAAGAPGPDLLYDAHRYRAVLLTRNRRPDDAADAYRACLACRPGDVEARLSLGLLLASRGSLREAERVLAEAVSLAPAHAPARVWLGKVLTDAGRADEGAAHFRAALALNPAEREDWLFVADRLLPDRNLAPSLLDFLTRYIRAYPDCAQGRLLLARLHLDAGRVPEAIAAFSDAYARDASLTWVPEKIAELRAQPR